MPSRRPVLLLLALAWTRTDALPTAWPGDPSGEVEAADGTLNEVFSQVLKGSDGRTSGALVRPQELADIYFHDDEHKLTVSTSGVRAAAASGWQVEAVDAVLEEQRATVALRVPRLDVSGAYAIDREAYDDFDDRESGSFTLVLVNVSAEGVAAVRVDGETLSLGRVVLKLRPQDERFEATRDARAARFNEYVDGGALGAALRRRLWRDVTQTVEAAARMRLRPALTRRPLSVLVPDADARTALQRYAYESTESADEFVDDVLGLARRLVREQHADRVTLPDLREGFQRKLLVVTLRGSFRAGGGYARGLSSVTRRGEATFARAANGTGFSIWGGVAFDDLTIAYDRYEAELMGVGPSGSLTADVYPLVLHMHVRVDFDDDRIYLEDFRVDEAGDLQVEVTGLGFLLNWLASRVASWVLAAYRDRVVDKLQESYATFFTDALARTSLNDIANGRAWTR